MKLVTPILKIKKKERDLDSSVRVAAYALRSLCIGSSGDNSGVVLDADMAKLIEAREKARVKARTKAVAKARAKASTKKKMVVVERKRSSASS